MAAVLSIWKSVVVSLIFFLHSLPMTSSCNGGSDLLKGNYYRVKTQPGDAPYTIYDHCYDSSKLRILKHPQIAFHFAGNATFVVPPRNSLVSAEDVRLLCFAYSSAGPEREMSVFGNTQQQNFNMIYDLGKNKLSFAPAVCDNL